MPRSWLALLLVNKVMEMTSKLPCYFSDFSLHSTWVGWWCVLRIGLSKLPLLISNRNIFVLVQMLARSCTGRKFGADGQRSMLISVMAASRNPPNE